MFPILTRRSGLVLLAALMALPALAACTGKEVRSSLGLQRNRPDEFQVVTRPPLSVPPSYHLRPPSEDEMELVTPADQRAEALLLQGRELPAYQRPEDAMAETAVPEVSTSSLGTTGDSLFLQNAGADKASPAIRDVLKQENAPIIVEEKREKGFFENITSKLRPGDGEPVVDAAKEQERLRSNKEQDKPLNEGEVPVIDPKQESVLDRLL